MILAFSIQDIIELRSQTPDFKWGFLGGVISTVSLLGVPLLVIVFRRLSRPKPPPEPEPGEEPRTGTQSGLEKRIANLSAEDLAGHLWHCGPSVARVKQSIRRNFPVISFVNFKGGVGKTTLAANIAAVFCDSNASAVERLKTLVVDCDWQGTLTSWLIDSDDDYEKMESGEKLLHKVLDGSAKDNLLSATHPVDGLTECRLLGASTTLADTEDITMLKWFGGISKVDPRYALRDWLDHDEVNAELEMVLIDCPPRLSTASMTALVASDYVIIPAIPDNNSLYSVPLLLEILRKNVKPFNPNLSVLGIALNKCRLHQNGLTQAAQNAIGLVYREDLKSSWNEPVQIFDQEELLIKNYPAAANDWDFHAFHDAEKGTFQSLAKMIKERTLN